MRIYIMYAAKEGIVKVGVSSNVPRRQTTLSKEHSLQLKTVYTSEELAVADAYVLEKLCHFALNEYHAYGEWFYCSDQVAINTIEYTLSVGVSTKAPPGSEVPLLILTPPKVDLTLESVAKRGAYLAKHRNK